MIRILTLCTLCFATEALACAPPPMAELEIHLAAVNAERSQAGRPPLALSPDLSSIAQGHACDMARRGYFSHTSPDGQSMMDRARRAGASGLCAMGENIAQGQSDVPTVVASWMRSPGHRRNILDPEFRLVGFGRGPDAHWVQVFAAPC